MVLKKAELRPHFYIPPFYCVLKSLKNSTYKRDANLCRSKTWRLYLLHFFPSPPPHVNKPPHPTPQINTACLKIMTVMEMVWDIIWSLTWGTYHQRLHSSFDYKITKIVRVPWLAERGVCMRVSKHGCDVIMRQFCFSCAWIMQAQIWKSFSDQNSTSLLYLPIPSDAESWKIFSNKLCQLFFA